ncbi:hypothetical protein JHK84_042408 [Glycine max]|nr:hypothetical protein JHK85_042814 [Glycine max]KAG5116295.1 hypothetical protein JHK84_042408 [Glycine max]
MGKLTSLRILTKFFVSKEVGFCLQELGPLKLKGDLDIEHLGKVKSVMDAKEANMSIKQLNTLWLSWDRNEESELHENVEEILEVLHLDVQQLLRLEVEEYLYEESYEGEVVFRALEELTLRWLPNLKRLSREDVENMFPRCSTLEIDDCPQFLRSGKFAGFTRYDFPAGVKIKASSKARILA